jgi:hypothetical protein
MAANPPVTSPVPLIPDVSLFLADVRARFVPNRYGQLDEQDFLEVFELAAQVFADWRHLNVKRVKGATYPVPYTDSLGLVPADYRILGMQAQAVNGVDAATGAAGVSAPPVFFVLLKDSAGTVEALLDAEATTVLTVNAKWVRISGDEADILNSFDLLELEDRDYAAGDVRRYVFPGGQTRLVQWRADSVGYRHPAPTGEDDDPIYAIFAPLVPEGIDRAEFDALKARIVALEQADGLLRARATALEQGQVLFWLPPNAFSVGNVSWGRLSDSVTFGGGHLFNVYGFNQAHNVYGQHHSYNRYGDGHEYNTFGDFHSYNTFGHSCAHNTFGDGLTACTVGSGLRHATLGRYLTACTIGPHCAYLQLGDNCQRVEVYNCHGTAQQPFVIAAGTTDAVYRNNALVVASAGTGGTGTGTDPNALPAPVVGGQRTVTVDFTLDSVVTLPHQRGLIGPNTGPADRNFLQGNWELRAYLSNADYKGFADSSSYAIIRKDYLETYVAEQLDIAEFEVMVTDTGKLQALYTAGAGGQVAVTEADSFWFGRIMYDEVNFAPDTYRWECAISKQANGAQVWRWFRTKVQ